MIEVSEQLYNEKFNDVYTWFRKKMNRPDFNSFIVIDLPGTHLKLVDIVNSAEKVMFRALLKFTFERLSTPFLPNFELRTIEYLQKTKSKFTVSSLAALNIFYIQLNRLTLQPMQDAIFLYSNNRLFELEKIY